MSKFYLEQASWAGTVWTDQWDEICHLQPIVGILKRLLTLQLLN
ncbi:MAG: hypothetical protein AAF985_02480 [Bacteroidota bacterium]